MSLILTSPGVKILGTTLCSLSLLATRGLLQKLCLSPALLGLLLHLDGPLARVCLAGGGA